MDKNEIDGETALNHMGSAKDVANVIVFLCLYLSDYVSGEIIGVDGCQIA